MLINDIAFLLHKTKKENGKREIEFASRGSSNLLRYFFSSEFWLKSFSFSFSFCYFFPSFIRLQIRDNLVRIFFFITSINY